MRSQPLSNLGLVQLAGLKMWRRSKMKPSPAQILPQALVSRLYYIASMAEKEEKKPLNLVSDGDENEDMASTTKAFKIAAKTVEGLQKFSLSDLPIAGNKDKLNLDQFQTAFEKDYSQHAVEADNAESEVDKLIVATEKGKAAIDVCLPVDIKTSYHVLGTEVEIYDALLIQTDIGDNIYKFYIIQILESDTQSRYHVYNRWGRVGTKGKDKLLGPYGSKDAAVHEFEVKFWSKSHNRWQDRYKFVPCPKKYTWLERDFDDVEQQKSEAKDVAKSLKPFEKPSNESKLADFSPITCNLNTMKQDICYEAYNLPFTKLSKGTISKSYEVLKRISSVMEGSQQGSLEGLSSEFYTMIPHNLGFKKMRSFIIDSPQVLKKKLEMVEMLGRV